MAMLGGSDLGLPFIISLNSGKADPATRRLIRSHVRRTRKGNDGRVAGSKKTNRNDCIRPTRIPLLEAVKLYTADIPLRPGGDVSFLATAVDVEASLLLNIVKISSTAMKVTNPLKAAIGLHADNERYLYPIGRDSAALHITAYAIEALIDKVLRRQATTNPRAMLHFQKGLEVLRERLTGTDSQASISDATIGVVLKMASIAYFEGDFRTSRQHMEGIRRMVDLRGGLDIFTGTELLAEIVRYDLAIALLNDSGHSFYTRPSEPIPEYPEGLLSDCDNAVSCSIAGELGHAIDKNLVRCWQILRRFCIFIDLGTQTQRGMRYEVIHDTSTSVICRLLRMRFGRGSDDEMIRLGLLAFCHHVFLQWQDIKPALTRFAAMYRTTIADLAGTDQISPRLMLWLLIISAISLFDKPNDAWLADLFQRYSHTCRVRRWSNMQTLLRKFLWIDLLDDEIGKETFRLLNNT